MPYPPGVRDEVIRLRDHDQDLREAWLRGDMTGDAVADMDAENAHRVASIVAEFGWPTANEDGDEVATAVWLLVQHSDHDPDLQRRCLDLMTTAVEQGEADPASWAMLTDRVLLAETGEQKYGTQWHGEGGRMAPLPIRDAEDVDNRRAEVGLGPLEQYRAELERAYAPMIGPTDG